jgi:hypothetical protein
LRRGTPIYIYVPIPQYKVIQYSAARLSPTVRTELELATAVERFYARKFGAKLEKWGALKVNYTVKKQKTPIKTGM